MPNIGDIAREAGVSTATVSRVFSNKGFVSRQARQAVLDAARRFDYAPKPYRRKVPSEFGSIVGVVMPDLCNRYFMEVIQGVESVLREHNAEVHICNTDEQAAREIQSLSLLKRIGVAGVIIAPVSNAEEYNVEFLNNMQRGGIPIVLLDRDIPGNKLDGVFMENYRAAYASIETFIHNGHTHIAIITGPDTSSSAEARLHGYMDALRAHGLPLRQEYILHGDFKTELAYTLTKRLFEEGTPVTAVFACNSSMSRGCMLALAESGRVIGRDVSFISCGRLEGMGERISSVLYPTQAIGAECANILLDRIAHRGGQRTAKRRVVFDMQLMLRGSESLCGTP